MMTSKNRTLLIGLMVLVLAGCDTKAGPDAGADGAIPTEDGGNGDCPTAGVVIEGEISSDTHWTCPLYILNGRIYVVNDASLTIAAGTTVLGEAGVPGGSALIITRGSRLSAIGTASDPIVFTSGNPEGERVTGDWAGVALMGSATTNDGSCVDDGDTSTAECDAPGYLEDRLEGIQVADDRGRYGGTDDASSCGELRYVRIEFAGAELSPDNELNGLTLGACGAGTILSHLQVHRAKDDGIELFGGTASLDHIVITGASDDGLDCDEGWRGTGQFIVVQQLPGVGDNGVECDSLGSDEAATPRTDPRLSNITLVGSGEGRAMVLREGFRGALQNFVITDFSAPPDLRAGTNDLSTEWPSSLSVEHSYLFNIGTWPEETGDDDDDNGFDERAAFRDPARNNHFETDPELDEAWQPAAALPGVAPSFGDTTADYAGAFEMGGSNWAEGWTAQPGS